MYPLSLTSILVKDCGRNSRFGAGTKHDYMLEGVLKRVTVARFRGGTLARLKKNLGLGSHGQWTHFPGPPILDSTPGLLTNHNSGLFEDVGRPARKNKHAINSRVQTCLKSHVTRYKHTAR